MCTCIKKVNKKLEPEGLAIDVPLQMDFTRQKLASPRCKIATYKLNPIKSRKKAPMLLASYCPFCGERYPDDD